MQLTIKDRQIILISLLPNEGTLEEVRLTKSVKGKIALSGEEEGRIKVTQKENGVFSCSFGPEAELEKAFALTEQEVLFLKNRVGFIDSRGAVQEAAIDTYDKILETVQNI